MVNTTQFPDLTKVLKVGDTVHSFMYGEGAITKIKNDNPNYQIWVNFNDDLIGELSFTKEGLQFTYQIFPSIHLEPWNPLTEPFPMPKFTPVVGEAYAFFDYEDLQAGYKVSKLEYIDNNNFPYIYVATKTLAFKHCIPIEEAHTKYMDYLNSNK